MVIHTHTPMGILTLSFFPVNIFRTTFLKIIKNTYNKNKVASGLNPEGLDFTGADGGFKPPLL